MRLSLHHRRRLLDIDLQMHQAADGARTHLAQQGLEQREGLALVFVERIALAVAAQADILAQMVEIDDVLAPVGVQRLSRTAFST